MRYVDRGQCGGCQSRVLPLVHVEVAPDDIVIVVILDKGVRGVGDGVIVGIDKDSVESHIREYAQIGDDSRLHTVDEVPVSAGQQQY